MTREVIEAIEYIKAHRKLDENLYNLAPPNSVSLRATKKCLEYWDMAIQALEQEPVLDKIRAEIEQVAEEENKHDQKWAKGLKYALKIIDKYRGKQNDNNRIN